MRKPRWELADVVREYGGDFEDNQCLSTTQKRVLRDIVTCRTASKGGHVERCDHCSHETIAYNSCRNRHCPKCQGAAQSQWLSDRAGELLPVEYFHVIFSVPKEVASIAFQNKKTVHGILFRAAWETLRQIASNPKYLGAEIGGLLILHTWGQNLEHHPHIHCVIPGGGLSNDRSQWISCPKGFFLPVRILSRLFRGKYLHHLKKAFEQGKLSFFGDIENLKHPETFRAHLAPLYKKDWFVYCRPPFGSPAQVLKYLSRYTHRVAISNYRLVDLKEGQVSFLWKDYAKECQCRVLTLTAEEFLRRYLLHILPGGLVRIRHFGFLANRCRKEKLDLCRRLLVSQERETESNTDGLLTEEDLTCKTCPNCKIGTMILISSFGPGQIISVVTAQIDSS
jgi:hypothetical protein